MLTPPVSDNSTKSKGIKAWLKRKLPLNSVAIEQNLQ